MKNKPTPPNSKMPGSFHKQEETLSHFILNMKWRWHRLFLKINNRFALLPKSMQWLWLLSFFMTATIALILILTKALQLTH